MMASACRCMRNVWIVAVSSGDRRKFGGGRARAVFSPLYLTRGGCVAWIVRLVKIGADGEEPLADVIKINRPDDLDDIANLGVDRGRRKAGAGRPPTGDRCRASREPLGSAAGVPKLWWRLSRKGSPEPCGRDASWPGHGSASSFSLCWVWRDRGWHRMALALPLDPGIGPASSAFLCPDALPGGR